MKNELIKSILEKLAIVIIGGLTVVAADFYADFRGVEDKDIQIDHFKDYTIVMDSLIGVNNKLVQQSKDREKQTLSNIKEMIDKGQELTIQAIEIAEDSVLTISPFETDSIHAILLTE